MADPRVAAALAWLKRHSSKSVRDGMLRYAIPNDNALGVQMGDIQRLGKEKRGQIYLYTISTDRIQINLSPFLPLHSFLLK